MKKYILVLLLLLNLKTAFSQDEGWAAALGIFALAGAAAATQDGIEEQLEYYATNYILENKPEISYFNLKVIKTSGTSSSDNSQVNIVPFAFKGCQSFEQDCNNSILFMNLSYGWMNEYGVDFSKISFYEYSYDEMLNFFKDYLELSAYFEFNDIDKIPIMTKSKSRALNENDYTLLDDKKWYKSDSEKSFLNLSISTSGRGLINRDGVVVFPFLKLEDGDSYIVGNHSEVFKMVFNEKKLGLYDFKNNELSQLSNKTLVEIHKLLKEWSRD